MNYILILVALVFTSLGQVFQKLAADAASQQTGKRSFLASLIRQKHTWLAIASLAMGTVFWLAVLSRMEVSKAYPFLSLGFVSVLLISKFYFHERISSNRWLGVVVIVAGIALLSRS